MQLTTKEQVIENNLKLLGRISENDMSKVAIIMERLKENKRIKYYIIDMIIFNQNTHTGIIEVSFWGD